MSIDTWHTVVPSVLGDLRLVRDQAGLRGLYFRHHWYKPQLSEFGRRADDGFAAATGQLGEYLAGARREFELPLARAGDEFQLAVWELIAAIPYGDTVTYGDLAARLGADATPQQVGAAVGRNPLSILIPCHRVIGRDGKLTGYAGGLARKRHLLELERDQVSQSHQEPLIPVLY
jgi:methylated-DNA-[protein]-cysteine S-methyltransferase